MAQQLSDGNHAVALLANTFATCGVLLCLIAAFGPISGSHLNPAFSFVDALSGGLSTMLVATSLRRRAPGFRGNARRLHWSFPIPRLLEGTREERAWAN